MEDGDILSLQENVSQCKAVTTFRVSPGVPSRAKHISRLPLYEALPHCYFPVRFKAPIPRLEGRHTLCA